MHSAKPIHFLGPFMRYIDLLHILIILDKEGNIIALSDKEFPRIKLIIPA